MFIHRYPDQSAIDHAVSFIDREAAHLAGTNNRQNDDFRRWAAISALNFVQHRVSSVNMSVAPKEDLRNHGVSRAEQTLQYEKGICGDQVEAFIAILQLLSVPVRDVQVYYVDDLMTTTQGHVLAEVQWGGSWRMFDVSWGYVPTDSSGQIISYAAARKRNARHGLQNGLNPWWLEVSAQIDPLSYLDNLEASVLTSGTGSVLLNVMKDTGTKTRRFDLKGLPPLGLSVAYDNSIGNVSYRVPLPCPGGYTAVFETINEQPILGGRRASITVGRQSTTLVDGMFEIVADDADVVLQTSSERIETSALTLTLR